MVNAMSKFAPEFYWKYDVITGRGSSDKEFKFEWKGLANNAT